MDELNAGANKGPTVIVKMLQISGVMLSLISTVEVKAIALPR